MTVWNADGSVSAAGAAQWTWEAAEGCLNIRAEAGGPFAKLDGRWRLDAFLNQIDGLARTLVQERLGAGRVGDAVDARITLVDGRTVHFVGSFCDLGLAKGLMVSGEAAVAPALGRSDVEPVFQPIRRLDDLSVAGFEALARFRTKDGKLSGPDALGSLGHETDWTGIAPAMLQASAQVLAEQLAQGRDVFMQVNLSAAEIARPLLVEEIAAIIRDAKLPRRALRIELTEQAALRDYEGALGALAAIRAAGAGVVLDDFGAGHSSFAWLAEIPADGVKLDPKLVRMVRLPRAGKIVTTLTGLIRSLGMTVTAEGVEDDAHAPELLAIGCDYVQGYAYDMPLRRQDIAVAFDPLPPKA